ncbi:anion permease [Candidatus Finniella inopinata]|uniref:Cyclic nucleotide-binding domain-containing protein n=1 Tax=Candidatus Finniella inopinata TaxID=1696036 RepID=A0A4Q7DLN5_9PROT|nr:SLC13 family permease [Candidatus Finniella inopinata]RZI47094.1 cyclic nucleotide-binding domain-containing protein [Candidatus Finniella inopinata]
MNKQLCIVEFMNSHPFLLCLQDSEKARILPHLEVMVCEPDQLIFEKNEIADSVYFIAEGSVLISSGRHKAERHVHESFGTEAAFKNNFYEGTAKAHGHSILVKLPFDILEKLLKTYPELGAHLFFHNTIHPASKPDSKKEYSVKNSASILRVLLAWIFSFIVPFVVYNTLSADLCTNKRFFLSILSSGLVLWSFNVVYEFIPVLLILVTTIILGIVPSRIVLEGFSSESYLLILTLPGIASVITSSGLVYRLVILMVRLLPEKQSWYSAGLFLIGSIITPIIPSAFMRSRLMAPLTQDLIKVLKAENQSSLATKIAVSNFYGVTSLSSVFLTGSLINFIALGILPLQSNNQISSFGWTTTTFVFGVVLLTTNLFGLSLFFQDRTHLENPKERLMHQLKVLGPLKSEEWHAVIVIFLFLASILTLSLHQIQFAWVSLFLFCVLASLKIIRIKDWAVQTDWSFLLLVGAGLGTIKAMSFLNIDMLIKDNLSDFINFFGNGRSQILMALILVSILVRFVFPVATSFFIMMAIGLPIADFYQINLWITTFCILVACEIWFFPYQSNFYRNFENFFEGKLAYERRKFLSYNILINAARILGLYLSMPYWRQIGLL